MKAYERLIKYAKIWTTSDDENSSVTPSTDRQFDLAKVLEEDMKALGLKNVHVDEYAYIYGELPATKGCEDKPAVGFIAHIDTAPDFNGQGVNPQIHRDYDGGDINIGCGRVIEEAKFPHLKNKKGLTLITTDGSSLLGADDKAGVSEILTAVEQLITEDIPHGKIAVCFTPDEEIGHGAELLDIPAFGVDFAYTVDGGGNEELQYGNFNAFGARLTFNGFNIHPGEAKDRMINAALIASEAAMMLPADETPARTCGREGFFHLIGMEGSVEKATLSYIVRDHDRASFEGRKVTLAAVRDEINKKYGEGTCSLETEDEYYNMEDLVKEHMEIVAYAEDAIKAQGLTPDSMPIRGGTDGARLSYRGLICPNLGTGGYAFHGPYEHIFTEDMDTEVKIILDIIANVIK